MTVFTAEHKLMLPFHRVREAVCTAGCDVSLPGNLCSVTRTFIEADRHGRTAEDNNLLPSTQVRYVLQLNVLV